MAGKNVSVENQKIFEEKKKRLSLVITILMMIVTWPVIESLLCLRRQAELFSYILSFHFIPHLSSKYGFHFTMGEKSLKFTCCLAPRGEIVLLLTCDPTLKTY